MTEKDSKFSSIEARDLNEAVSPLEKFAKKVFDKLIEEGVPPLPYYYRIYFFNMLDDEDINFRKHIYEMIAVEESNENEKDFELERKLKLSFKYSKELLQRTAMIYKNANTIKELLNKYADEISFIASPKALEKTLKQFEAKLEAINKKLDLELNEVKKLYSKNIEVLKEIESNSMFDQRYGVYNKKYFLKIVQKEIKLIDKFSHVSSVVTIKIKDEILRQLKNEKNIILANRSVSKIILKTSRRTDTVAHLGEGIFAMLLKNTDRIGASKTIERLSDMISTASVFFEGEEVEIQIVGGVVEIKDKKDAKEYVENAINVMREAEEEGMLYKVYEGE
ncbi:GGDEF domain-containing protein [Caminibacter pacificus]|uniref:Diguanylate cyclase n=1 Tax=Caminibacter pacificus TaxID=1424653 RepID=A0AAJ4RBC1_9BACT|nr:diguanylate cyclase [Caminibacter pacificus]QCI29101.1 diguanylate cyclase [Caminibacter pacificus]ROR39078.1 diguanylate cyclase (GGDEF)-like protein [Caminibacter pacificus]